MDFILLLIEAVVVVVFICTAREIVVRQRHKSSSKCVAPLCSPRLRPIDMARPSIRPNRQVKRISIGECEKLVHSFDNVVFIALRQESVRTPLPFPAMHAVSVAPGELVDVLRLIPDCYVVLCGEVDLDASIFEALEDIARSMPVYVLEDAADRAEIV